MNTPRLPTALPTIEQDKFTAAIETLRRNLHNQIEYHQIQAKIRRAAFDAYLAEGFNEAQALELCAK